MEEQTYPPPAMRIAITCTVITAVMMQVIDTTIANVALPHIQATVGATQESIAWVLTSYIVASAIATPLTGWLEAKLGRRELFLVSVLGFTISSGLCAASFSLSGIVLARVLQGAFGAFMIPLSQAVVLDTFPPEKRASAVTIWGLGIMVGPVIGPMLGGWLTDQFTWRWVFLVNLPVGLLTTISIMATIPRKKSPDRTFDAIGYGYLAIMLASLQLFLDRGTQLDWLSSKEIIIEMILTVAAGWMFVVHCATDRAPIFPPALVKDRNYVAANIMVLVIMGQVVAGTALITPMLQQLMGYSVVSAGLLSVPRGLAMAGGMIVAGRVLSFIDVRIIMVVGFVLVGTSQLMMAGYTLGMGKDFIIVTGMIQGLGAGMVSMPLNLTVFSTLPPHLRSDGAAGYSLCRGIGGSIAISICSALLAHNVQVSHSDLTQHITAATMPILGTGLLAQMGQAPASALAMIDAELNRQATMVAYIDDFWLLGCVSLAMLPIVLLVTGQKPQSEPGAMAVE